jgi:hypothetical protein
MSVRVPRNKSRMGGKMGRSCRRTSLLSDEDMVIQGTDEKDGRKLFTLYTSRIYLRKRWLRTNLMYNMELILPHREPTSVFLKEHESFLCQSMSVTRVIVAQPQCTGFRIDDINLKKGSDGRN